MVHAARMAGYEWSKSLKANLSLSTPLKSYGATGNGGGRWVEVQFCSFLTSTLGGPWSTSHPRRFSPRTEPRNQLSRRRAGFQRRYGRFEEENSPDRPTLHDDTYVGLQNHRTPVYF